MTKRPAAGDVADFFLNFFFLSGFTGLMVARAAALRTNINIDGRPLPTQKRRRTSTKHCAPHILHACAPRFHLPVN